jgi:hypothetical protein
VSIKVTEEVINVFRSGSVPIPFSNIEGQQGLVGVGLRLYDKFLKVVVKKGNEILVKVFTKKVC